MKIINRPRQTGKTTILIYTAHATGLPIVTLSKVRVDFIIKQAAKLGVKGIKVFSFAEWRDLIKGTAIGIDGVLIDEAGDFIAEALEEYFKSHIVACTVTFPMDEIPTEKEEATDADKN